MYGIVHAVHAVHCFDERTRHINYFNFSARDQSLIMRLFPSFCAIEEHFIRVGDRLRPLRLDRLETALFCALLLLSPGEPLCMPVNIALTQPEREEAHL